MFGPGERALDVAEVERIIKSVEPSVRFVSPQTLRRVIKRDRGIASYGFQVPHRQVYSVSAASDHGAEALTQAEVCCNECASDDLILLPRPDSRDLAASSPATVLWDAWRLLFHARVHVILERKASEGLFDPQELQARIDAIGHEEFQEIRSVLRAEGMLLPPEDDLTTYVEFAAYYLELRRFSPHLLAHTFPGVENHEKVASILARDVDDQLLFEETRPGGAWDPELLEDQGTTDGSMQSEVEEGRAEIEVPETRRARLLVRRATAAAKRGNDVRAAILKTRAARQAHPAFRESFELGAQKDLERLVQRIQQAVLFDPSESKLWLQSLTPLLERASRGFWTAEARFLYDLQKVCIDHERPVFRIDVWDWLRSFGQRPLRRDQPLLRVVMAENHLQHAAHRLASLRLGSEDRNHLRHLIHQALLRADERLRQRLYDPIATTLTAQGFIPTNLPERVAFEKLVAELLDRISDRGRLSLGDLRDACSRSNLKLPDLTGFREFFHGDRLLQADHALEHALDGVYRRGEVYLRWLQRFSALAFATRWGRFLTLFVALPYGGAFIALEGLQHLIGPVVYHLGAGTIRIQNNASFLTLGTIALGVVNFLSFRSRFLVTVRAMGRLVHRIISRMVAWILKLPLIRELFEGQLTTFAWNYGIKPALFTLPILVLAQGAGLGERTTSATCALGFLVSNLLLNSRVGRHIEEAIAEEAARGWRYATKDLIPGLFRLVMASFDTVLETVDRLIYAVDEWLRFRAGQTRLSLIVKALLGSIWFLIAYMVRIYVNLLIEPQVNPIKHFPVVTVSHKVILPLSLTLTHLLAAPLMPLGPWAANFIAGTTVLLLPGVFGFLVWEFKENWRLYEANRDENLKKVIVGHHGESMGRLLRPGFHSGTIPKLFAKLRKSERRRQTEAQQKRVARLTERLHHVEAEIERFITRDFLALVKQSHCLESLNLVTGDIRVATNRVGIGLRARGQDQQLALLFEERSGRLIASVVDPGWIGVITDAQRRALLTAIVGLYKMAGVEHVRPPARVEDERSHKVSSGRSAESESFPIVQVEISWRRWVDAWQRDQAGLGHPPRFVVGIPFLPTPSPSKGKGKNRRPSRR